jgi:tetratricopeptide (TPR) repeat protein
MKRALAILVGVVLVCVAAYLSWLNPTTVEFRYSPARSLQAPLAALMLLAFVVGLLLVLSVGMISAGRRAFVAWRQGRQQRRIERIEEWEERGEDLVWRGEIQQGRALLQKAWQRRPESAHAVLALATSYQDTGELDRARGLLTEAAQQHHTNPGVLLSLAEAHRVAGEHAACIEVLERLRALQPRAARVVRALRDSYVEARRWQDAAALQEALLAELRDPEHAARERDLLTALRYQVSLHLPTAEARVQPLEALADHRAGSVPVLVSLGDALLAAGRGDEASVLWERALRSTPRTVLVERLSGLATEARHRDRLRTLLRKLRTDQVQAANVSLLTAELHLADGNVDEAARELETIADPGHAPALLHDLWAEVHRRRGQLEQAINAYALGNGKRRAYHCTVCQHDAAEWTGYCLTCGGWDSYRSDVEISVG